MMPVCDVDNGAEISTFAVPATVGDDSKVSCHLSFVLFVISDPQILSTSHTTNMSAKG